MTAMVFLSVREAANQRAESSTFAFPSHRSRSIHLPLRVSLKNELSLSFSLSLFFSLLVPIFFSKSFPSGRHLSPRNSSSLFVPSSFGERMKRKA